MYLVLVNYCLLVVLMFGVKLVELDLFICIVMVTVKTLVWVRQLLKYYVIWGHLHDENNWSIFSVFPICFLCKVFLRDFLLQVKFFSPPSNFLVLLTFQFYFHFSVSKVTWERSNLQPGTTRSEIDRMRVKCTGTKQINLNTQNNF